MYRVHIKKHKTLPVNSHIDIDFDRINNRLVFKIKDGNKFELQTPETMKLFGSIKKLMGKTKNKEIVPSLEVVEVSQVQCNLVDNKYQQESIYWCYIPYV